MKKVLILTIFLFIALFGFNLQAQVTVSSSIDSNEADSEEAISTGIIKINSSDLELFNENESQEIGLHFKNLNIPSTATITNAYVQFSTDEESTGAVSMNIYAEASDNPQIWSTTNGDITSRTKTNAFVQWSPPDWNTIGERGVEQQTPDLTSIIQEIMGRPSYASANPINIIFSGVSGGSRVADSYTGSTGNSPKLFVTYNVPSSTPTAPTLSSTEQTDTTVDLSWLGATDDIAVTGYKVYKDGVLETTLGNVLTYQVISLLTNTSYSFTVTALDASGNESMISNALTITTDTFSLPIRINAGGLQVNYNGDTFYEDQYFTEGSSYTSSNTSILPLYRVERFENFSYSIPLENGSYDITLHFIEFYFNSSGNRVFDVKIEDDLVLNNYDIYTEVGNENPTTKSFNGVIINDGTLNLEFTNIGTGGETGPPMLSGFEIFDTDATSGGGEAGNWSLNNQDVYYNTGNVGIGTITPGEKLTVKGSIHSEEVKVDLSVPAPDYVFETDYTLTPLEKLLNYIEINKHLPNIPSAKEMEANGVELGIMNMKLLEKIEELTLYILEQQNELESQKIKNQNIENRLISLEKLKKQ